MRKLILIVGLMLLFLSCSDKKIVNVENCKGNCDSNTHPDSSKVNHSK